MWANILAPLLALFNKILDQLTANKHKELVNDLQKKTQSIRDDPASQWLGLFGGQDQRTDSATPTSPRKNSDL